MKFFLLVPVFCLFFSNAHGQTLVSHSDTWRYRKGTSAPQGDWKTTPDAQLDGTWLTGAGGFGFADNTPEVALCQTILNDMDGNYSTIGMRKSFEVSAAPDPTAQLVLTMDWDDGFIAWLDGSPVAGENSPGYPSEPGFSAVATASHESSRGNKSPEPAKQYPLGAVGSRLAPGTHILAIIGLNSSKSSSSDFVQVADLALKTVPANCLTGPIAVDTRLEGTNSICGSITIQPGATLTIAPGARIELDQDVSIRVADGGRLLAEGVETNRIVFTKAPTATAWDGIVIEGSVGSPETRMSFADIEFNGTKTIHSSGGTVFLDHLNFLTTDYEYVSLDSSSFIVSNCYFPHGTREFEPGHGNGGIKSGGHGIFTHNYFGGAIGYSDLVDFTGGHRGGPIVHFINNVFMNGQDDGLDLDGTDAWVEGNIFLHIHRNGDTPDSSSAVSGGNFGADVSAVTIIGNLFFDCDNAATAKQGNFFTLLNNTIVHMTKTGGIDGASGAVVVRDTTPSPTMYALGMYLENNVISDIEQLVRNYDPSQTTVTLNNNVLPVAWTGPGVSNVVAEALFGHVPTIPETQFTNWTDAQSLRDWLKLATNSPGIGTGWEGTDEGAYTLPGALISVDLTKLTNNSVRVDVGYDRTGNGIPTTGWPEGTGYAHYRWRLDAGAWSDSVAIESPILLTNLSVGPHFVEVSGQRDSGLFQDDGLFGADATTRTITWTVSAALEITNVARQDGKTLLAFSVSAAGTYSVEYKNSLSNPGWTHLSDVIANSPGTLTATDETTVDHRFYRVVLKQ